MIRFTVHRVNEDKSQTFVSQFADPRDLGPLMRVYRPDCIIYFSTALGGPLDPVLDLRKISPTVDSNILAQLVQSLCEMKIEEAAGQ